MLKVVFPVIALLIIAAFPINASLIIIADLGGKSTAPLFSAIAPEPDTPAFSSAFPLPLSEAVFPVRSPRLHPGSVIARQLSLPGMTPLFLIGDDPLSAQWLDKNKARLKSLNATGLVVSVASTERFRALRENADGLALLPVSGDDLAQRLQLATYPVLITASGLSQ
ncbi:integrating conjugative element protein [Lonsdalea quercina]|uniref:integrating conjugative element protein n=1 Tax=Lonsdalea quercina TaxID=71657 RepID=UPI0039747682